MMDHLCKYWGIDEIRVPFLLDKAQMGRIEELSQNAHFNDFKAFPEGDGWKLRNDDVLEGSKGADHSKKPAILQAWLFFGLIAFILRTDIALLTFDDLTSGDHQTKFLTTKNLPEKLQKWHDWIKNTTHDKAKLYERLIDADRALEIARKNVASVNFEERPKSEVPISLSGSAIDSGKHARSDSADYDYEDNDDDASNYESDPHKLDNESKQRLELCLMVLGETLSAAKIHIMKDLGLKINGWFIDDDEGWGPPSYILTRMRESHWCLRLQTVLRGQLGSSAILLCAAWANHSEDYSNDEEEQHKDCKESQCLHVQGQKAGQGSGSDENRSKKGTVTYDPQHHGDCQQRWACELLGPTMKDVYSILDCADLTREAHDFPLFRIISEGVTSGKSGKSGSKVRYRVRGITVEKWDRQEGRSLRRPNFATISHVWSQGMGNGRANSLQACQLEFIKSALEKTEIEGLESPEPEFFSPLVVSALKKTPLYWKLSKPFWLDTLGIPVVEDGADEESSRRNTERKQRAIRQIYHIFNSATCSIIIDKELCKVSDGLEPSQILIRVLTSPWMRRLWTLQEAFLSRRLCVALTHSGNVILSDLDQLVARLDGTNKHMDLAAFNLSMGELIKRKLYYNLMGEDRKIRNRKEHPVQTRGSMVIASAWHSTRWRSTTRLEDETLALSTLLNLDFRGTSIERAGGEESDRRQGREQMIQEFWTLIHRTYEGSIPAGLIFLPSERLSKVGFGWAPSTWMSSKDEDHPHPLTMVSQATELHQEGLLVHYPGFLLHGGDPRLVLAANYSGERKVEFPVDRYLTEWYTATVIPEDEEDEQIRHQTRDQTPAARDIITNLNKNKAPYFGIILSRPKPRESPPEIGLLVEVYREIWRRKEPERVNKKIYCCQIIRRVQVSRIASPSHNKFSLPSGNPNEPPIGELMPEDSMWCVDGYQNIKDREQLLRSSTQQPRVNDSVPLPPQNILDAVTSPSSTRRAVKSQSVITVEPERLVEELPSKPISMAATNGSVTAQMEATHSGQPKAYEQGDQHGNPGQKSLFTLPTWLLSKARIM